MKRFTLGLAVLAAALAASAPAGAAPRTTSGSNHAGTTTKEIRAQARRVASLPRGKAAAVRDRSAHVLTFFAKHRWMVASRHATCWSHVPWAKTCDRARRQLFRHRRLHAAAVERIRVLEERALVATTSTYLGSVAYVERYFGAQPFLRSCPDGEGGFGRFVMNTQGSDAGGWLQFMPGTFYGIIDEALASARAAGMAVPSSARDWHSPLGQALAGRQMLVDGRRSEWTGRNC